MTEPLARTLKRGLRRVLYRGTDRFCDVCGETCRKFLRYGSPRRDDACCPWCRALERHRLAWRYFRDHSDLFDGRQKRVLHVAPEVCFRERLAAKLGSGYLTADISGRGVMEQMDITRIQHPDNTFDVVYCSHVLEHVTDDLQAMREFRRVLKPDGWAVLLVPIHAKVTFEDPTITDPRERKRVFHQHDHVRNYGPDFADRLRDAGFQVQTLTPKQIAPDADRVACGLATSAAGDIYVCRK